MFYCLGVKIGKVFFVHHLSLIPSSSKYNNYFLYSQLYVMLICCIKNSWNLVIVRAGHYYPQSSIVIISTFMFQQVPTSCTSCRYLLQTSARILVHMGFMMRWCSWAQPCSLGPCNVGMCNGVNVRWTKTYMHRYWGERGILTPTH